MSNAKKRECLKCRRSFLSSNPGRRICTRCTAVNEKIYTPNTIVVTSDKTLNGKTIPPTRK